MTGRFASTLEGLRGFGAVAEDLHKHVPRQTAMSIAARRIADMFELPRKPGDEELLRALRLFQAWCAGQGPSPSPTDWELAPWVALQGTPALIACDAFTNKLAELLGTERQPRLLRALIYSYLRDYRPEEAGLLRAGELITKSLSRHNNAWSTRWRERAAGVKLFSAKGLPERIVDQALVAGGDLRSSFRTLGFTTELMTHSGLHEPVADALLLRLAEELQQVADFSGETVRNALGFLRRGDELQFPSLRVRTADLLLVPFAHKELRNLPARAILMQFFDELYGDPRSHRQKWIGVSQEARKTITRWLSRKALDLFFDILSATADPIWKWRRAFWLALERHGLIDEAWPIFGKEAQEYLRKNPDKRTHVVVSGRLQGALRNQSVMLMRIGKFVIAEWSHSGSARVWAEDDDRAPRLEQGFYSASELRADCLYDQRHDSTWHYGWQRELMDFLAPRIGTRVSIAEMKP